MEHEPERVNKLVAELERLLAQRIDALEQAEADFDQRVLEAVEQLAAKMVLEARLERNAARQRARRLQHKLDLIQNVEAGSLMNPQSHLLGQDN